MRGKLESALSDSVVAGITPAGAGKTHQIPIFPFYRWDHPRRCGENISVYNIKRNQIGSPPQVRGKPLLSESTTYSPRITPAGAGKTFINGEKRCMKWDHPRRCGENQQLLFTMVNKIGSPPQVRGKRKRILPFSRTYRITPAGAGKTIVYAVNAAYTWDHPRRCGENIEILLIFPFTIGSPPQVRGKQCKRPKNTENYRITPAGAGKTQCHYFARKRNGDHPRRCGEN